MSTSERDDEVKPSHFLVKTEDTAQYTTSKKRQSDQPLEESIVADSRHAAELRDSLYLSDQYLRQLPMPEFIRPLALTRTQKERLDYYNLMKQRGLPMNQHHTNLTLISRVGVIFSNVLLSAYIQKLRRPNISFSLYTQCFNGPIPLYQTGCQHPAYLCLKLMIFTWFLASKIFKKGGTTIHRTGLLVDFTGYKTENGDSRLFGHEILIIVERSTDGVICYVVDNLSTQFYRLYAKESNIFNLVRDIIHEFDKKIIVYEIVSGLPMVDDFKYTCISCARRAAIYAAILENYLNLKTWNEEREQTLFQFHLRHYITQMHKMLEWYDYTPEFWDLNGPCWTLWPSRHYVPFNPENFSDTQRIVELKPEHAYIRVKQGDATELKKLWYCSNGPTPFSEDRASSGCITSNHFETQFL